MLRSCKSELWLQLLQEHFCGNYLEFFLSKIVLYKIPWKLPSLTWVLSSWIDATMTFYIKYLQGFRGLSRNSNLIRNHGSGSGRQFSYGSSGSVILLVRHCFFFNTLVGNYFKKYYKKPKLILFLVVASFLSKLIPAVQASVTTTKCLTR